MIILHFIDFAPREVAAKLYSTVSGKVAAIDVNAVKQSVQGSLQTASQKLSNYWQDLQNKYYTNY